MGKSLFNIKKPGSYDFILAIATIVILVALSAVSIYGTIVSWLNSVGDPNWTTGLLYVDYLNRMNSYAYPFAIALVLALCMCIPKRFVPRAYLLQLSLILLSLSVALGVIWGFSVGLGFILMVSIVIQSTVVIMVLLRSGGLVFEREGLIVQLGSSLLHLGFVVFALDLVAIKEIQTHLIVFWVSTTLIILGSVLSFYSRELSSALKHATGDYVSDSASVLSEES